MGGGWEVAEWLRALEEGLDSVPAPTPGGSQLLLTPAAGIDIAF